MNKSTKILDAPLIEVFQDHLSYEFMMLASMYVVLRGRTFRNQIEANAFIESFCVHARNLYEFFDEMPAANLNVARDFTNKNFTPFVGNQKTILKKLIGGKVNNQITHLKLKKRTNSSLERVGDSDRAEMFNILSDILEQFQSHLLPGYEVKDWPADIVKFLRTIGVRIV